MIYVQEEISDHETFQLEFEPAANKWYIRTMQVQLIKLQLLVVYPLFLRQFNISLSTDLSYLTICLARLCSA